MDKPEFSVVALSGGKDSTAMLLGMIERGMQIDCILFCDTGLEFPAMYEHITKLEKDIGIPITRVRAEKSFEELMFYADIKRKPDSMALKRYGPDIKGYGWAGPRMRWCTARLKDEPREKFLREIRKEYTIKEYIGLAADEGYRLERKQNRQPGHVHPLVDWGMTEADCLKYCYNHGYDWGGLYEQFKRVSCWCCPLQPLSELRELYYHHPALWEKLKEWDRRTWRQFRADYSVEQLEVRFLFEEECIRAGKSVQGKRFFAGLRERLAEMEG